MNNVETEFKFIVSSLPIINFDNAKKEHYVQIYFDGTKKLDRLKEVFGEVDLAQINTFRIRKIGEDSKKIILTIKSKSLPNGMSRIELEKEITEDLANDLMENNILSCVVKDRYIDNFAGFTFEFDRYINLRIQLITLEVEVEGSFEYDILVNKLMGMIKDHYGLDARDVTFNPIYKNSNLIKYFG